MLVCLCACPGERERKEERKLLYQKFLKRTLLLMLQVLNRYFDVNVVTETIKPIEVNRRENIFMTLGMTFFKQLQKALIIKKKSYINEPQN